MFCVVRIKSHCKISSVFTFKTKENTVYDGVLFKRFY